MEIDMIRIPFTVYARIFPDRKYNKRRTYTKSLEKLAKYVADDIKDYIDSNPTDYGIHINEPNYVLSTPQFAQRSARLTITGWHIQDINNFQPASKILVDAPFTDAQSDNYGGTPGKTVEGHMGTQYLHPQGQTMSVSPDVKALMRSLKSSLESASPYLDDIFRIDYMGLTFGETGHSF